MDSCCGMDDGADDAVPLPVMADTRIFLLDLQRQLPGNIPIESLTICAVALVLLLPHAQIFADASIPNHGCPATDYPAIGGVFRGFPPKIGSSLGRSCPRVLRNIGP